MSKKRKGMSRAEFLADRERRYQEAVSQTEASTVYHIRHSCGHAVYWDNLQAGFQAKEYPCLWCGAETGMPAPPTKAVCTQMGHIRQEMSWCPKHETPDQTIIVRHMTDESCCQAFGSIN